MTVYFRFWIGVMIFLFACQPHQKAEEKNIQLPFENDSRPYCRYWWFASEIQKEDIRYNLDWLKAHGFGGVEIAWVYPQNRMVPNDSGYAPRYEWLSPEWQEIVNYTILYADSIGLGCDLTFGTLWPFGDSYVPFEEATQKYGDPGWRQKITASWEYPMEGYVVDHLQPKYYERYFQRLLDSFPRPDTRIAQSYFIDSWEVESKYLWTDGFAEEFIDKYAYDIRPYMDSIYTQSHGMYRYDYMKLISEKIIDFYQSFDQHLNGRQLFSRGQCSGAPCDIISAYARLDIPEGEALLYEPEFNSIPASAAVLSSKKQVSAETFTCLYGWPRNYIREEQTADLKMLADALFANGINHIIWHGKPHNPSGQDSIPFYASVHVGPDGKLAGEMKEFNRYLENVSCLMKKGKSYSEVAVYLPVEDAWIKGEMPPEMQFKWAWGFYEMRYVYFPEELKGYHPLWINREFLDKAVVENNKLVVGDADFSTLSIDVQYLDYESLQSIYRIAKTGFPLTMINRPAEAGSIHHGDFESMLDEIYSMENVRTTFKGQADPLIEGKNIPPYWCREENETLYLFFANPKSAGLKFPLSYGQSFTDRDSILNLRIHYRDKSYELRLVFKPYESLIYKIDGESIKQIIFDFIPLTPEVIAVEESYEAPWLVR